MREEGGKALVFLNRAIGKLQCLFYGLPDIGYPTFEHLAVIRKGMARSKSKVTELQQYMEITGELTTLAYPIAINSSDLNKLIMGARSESVKGVRYHYFGGSIIADSKCCITTVVGGGFSYGRGELSGLVEVALQLLPKDIYRITNMKLPSMSYTSFVDTLVSTRNVPVIPHISEETRVFETLDGDYVLVHEVDRQLQMFTIKRDPDLLGLLELAITKID